MHLEDLCKKNVSPRKYHPEYFEINASNKIPNVLQEIDQEYDVAEELEQ